MSKAARWVLVVPLVLQGSYALAIDKPVKRCSSVKPGERVLTGDRFNYSVCDRLGGELDSSQGDVSGSGGTSYAADFLTQNWVSFALTPKLGIDPYLDFQIGGKQSAGATVFSKTADTFRTGVDVNYWIVSTSERVARLPRGSLESTVSFETQAGLFGPAAQGFDVQSQPVDYSISELDGSVTQVHASSLKLSRSFSPLTYFLFSGLDFDNLLHTEAEKGQETPAWHLGGGGYGGIEGRTISADGQLARLAYSGQGPIPLARLASFQEAGPSFGVYGKGWAFGGVVTLDGRLDMFVPSLNNSPIRQSYGALSSVDTLLQLSVAVQLNDYISITYEHSHERHPTLVDVEQVTHKLNLNLGFLLESSKPRKAPDATASL